MTDISICCSTDDASSGVSISEDTVSGGMPSGKSIYSLRRSPFDSSSDPSDISFERIAPRANVLSS